MTSHLPSPAHRPSCDWNTQRHRVGREAQGHLEAHRAHILRGRYLIKRCSLFLPERQISLPAPAACHDCHQRQVPKRPDGKWSEEDFNETSTLDLTDPPEGYWLSKVLAEKEAWALAERHGLDLVTILPEFVMGPVMTRAAAETSTSAGFMKVRRRSRGQRGGNRGDMGEEREDGRSLVQMDGLTLMTIGTHHTHLQMCLCAHNQQAFLEPAPDGAVPAGDWMFCDVRDVAEAHMLAALSAGAKGRFIVSQPVSINARQVSDILKVCADPRGSMCDTPSTLRPLQRMCRRTCRRWSHPTGRHHKQKTISTTQRHVSSGSGSLDSNGCVRTPPLLSKQAPRELGLQITSVEKTITDMADSLIALGFAKPLLSR